MSFIESIDGTTGDVVTRMTVITSFAQDRKVARAVAHRFSRLVRTSSEDAHAWHALGTALVALGDQAGACSAFVNALRLDGSRVHSQRALGNLLFDCGQYDRALRCFAMCESPR